MVSGSIGVPLKPEKAGQLKPHFVMAVLVTAIHDLPFLVSRVDGRDSPGHDESALLVG